MFCGKHIGLVAEVSIHIEPIDARSWRSNARLHSEFNTCHMASIALDVLEPLLFWQFESNIEHDLNEASFDDAYFPKCSAPECLLYHMNIVLNPRSLIYANLLFFFMLPDVQLSLDFERFSASVPGLTSKSLLEINWKLLHRIIPSCIGMQPFLTKI